MKKLLYLTPLLLLFFFITPDSALAAGCTGTGNCYWVGGTGNANDTTKWATASGGAVTGGLPSATDNCTFDTLSNATGYTVTVNATTNCLDLTLGAPLTGVLTFAGSSQVNISGNFSVAGTNVTPTHTGSLNFAATSGTKTITTNGVTLTQPIIFNGVGGTFQLADNLTTNRAIAGGGIFTLTNGIFDPNGKTVSLTGGTGNIVGAFTFYNLTLTGTAVKSNAISLSADIVVTNNFVATGNSKINRMLLKSNTTGTQRTITAANVSVNAVDFMDIVGAGAGSWNLAAVSDYSGDAGGNSGITFTTAATQTSTGTASFTWSTHGWTSRVPLPQDDVVVNNAFVAGSTVTADMPRLGKSITFGCTGSPTLTMSGGTEISIFGSLDLTGVGAFTAANNSITFGGRSSYSITSATLNIDRHIILAAPGGTLQLLDNTAVGAATQRTFTLTAGTFDLNDKTFTHFGTVTNTGSITRSVDFGTGGVWNITNTNTATVWNASGSSFTTSGTGTIKISGSTTNVRTFTGGGFTYKDLWFSNATNAGQLTINGSNTFLDFKAGVEGNAQTIIFTAGTTQTFTTFTVSGASGNLITINSNTTGTHALVKTGGGQVSSDYLNIQHSVATPACTWFAGVNSTNNQGVATAGSGWTFTAPSACGGATYNFWQFSDF